MLVFGHSGYPVILFPTLQGRYYECKDSGLISSAERLIDEGKIKIYCPDGIDSQSWNNYSIKPSDRVKTHNAYEKVILHDVIEFARYETDSKHVCVAGCGFGGFHAVNIAFRNPNRIGKLISLSGQFDIKRFIFGFYDDNCYFNNPPDYMPNLEDLWYLDKIKNMKIILGTGEWDSSFAENKNMGEILTSKKIPHFLDVRGGSIHNLQCWKEILPYYLSLISQEQLVN